MHGLHAQLAPHNATVVRLLPLDLTEREGLETGQLVARVTSGLSLVQQLLAEAPMMFGSWLWAGAVASDYGRAQYFTDGARTNGAACDAGEREDNAQHRAPVEL